MEIRYSEDELRLLKNEVKDLGMVIARATGTLSSHLEITSQKMDMWQQELNSSIGKLKDEIANASYSTSRLATAANWLIFSYVLLTAAIAITQIVLLFK